MESITKAQFIDRFKQEFSGDDKSGYTFRDVHLSESDLGQITEGLIVCIGELRQLLTDVSNGQREDEYADVHNFVMAHVMGDGKVYQGSFEESLGTGDYCWFLDFGAFSIDSSEKRIMYSGIKLYKDG